MEDYLNSIDEDLWRSFEKGSFRLDLVQAVGTVAASEYRISQWNKMKENDIICLHELIGTLPPVVYNYIRENKIVKVI